MPRKYIKKNEPTYNLESLQRAVQEIKEKKIPFRQAAHKYGIPVTTLFDQVKKVMCKKCVSTMPKRGRKAVFNESQEKELVKIISKSCKAFVGITIPSLRKIAFNYAAANNIPNDFNKDSKMAGMEWYYNFMARHPNISRQRQEDTSINRIAVINQEETDILFDNLKTLEGFGDMFASASPHEQQKQTNANNSRQSESQDQTQVIYKDLSETIPTSDVSTAGSNQSITSHTCSSPLVPQSDVVEVPTLKPDRTKRLVKKRHSIIFTSTPEKVNLKIKKRKENETRKNKNYKKESKKNKRFKKLQQF